MVPFANDRHTGLRLLGLVDALSRRFDVKPIPLGLAAQERVLELMDATRATAFIKWDTRPANAIVAPDGVVRWFDWEHCNRRWRADDHVWLLCDETVPDADEREPFAPRLPDVGS